MSDNNDPSSTTEERAPAGDERAPAGEERAAGGGFQAAINHMSSDKVMAAMWVSRMVTIFFSLSFLIPVFGWSQPLSGQRVLIAGAITSALRLHQRVPGISLNREFIGMLMKEDSAHYLLYSVLMLFSCQPVSIILMPVFFFALLHMTKYTKTLLDCMGPTYLGFLRRIILKIDTKQREILRLIATVEISLMPISILLVFSGTAAIVLPLGYYRFVCLRYSSIRNPYNRSVFGELRLLADYLSRDRRCPAFIGNIILKIVAFTCRMAPALPTPEATAQQ